MISCKTTLMSQSDDYRPASDAVLLHSYFSAAVTANYTWVVALSTCGTCCVADPNRPRWSTAVNPQCSSPQILHSKPHSERYLRGDETRSDTINAFLPLAFTWHSSGDNTHRREDLVFVMNCDDFDEEILRITHASFQSNESSKRSAEPIDAPDAALEPDADASTLHSNETKKSDRDDFWSLAFNSKVQKTRSRRGRSTTTNKFSCGFQIGKYKLGLIRILDSRNLSLAAISLEIRDDVCIAAILGMIGPLLAMEAKRVFSLNGAEYSLSWSTNHIAQGEIVVVTDGGPFLPHTMQGVAMALAGEQWKPTPKPTPEYYLLK